MRFTALALGGLGLAVGAGAVNNGIKASETYNKPTPTLTMLTRTIPSISFPTRSVSGRDLLPPPPPADPMSLPCLNGSTTREQYPQTMSCSGAYPSDCTRYTSTVYVCVPTASSSSSIGNQFGGRTTRWVADFAQPTFTADAPSSITAAPKLEQAAAMGTFTQPLCSWDSVNYEYICPKKTSSQPLCSWDTSKYVYVCPTPAPTKAARAYTVPLCSWNTVNDEYICPASTSSPTPAPTPAPTKAARAYSVPLCSWDTVNDKYICATSTSSPAPAPKMEKKDCPEGVGMCIPEGEQPEVRPCKDGVEMCVPAGETPEVTPTPKVARTVSVHDPLQPKPQVTGGMHHFTISHITFPGATHPHVKPTTMHTTTKASTV